MTEEEFKKAMTKTIVFIIVMIIVLIVIGILVFNNSEKSKSIFKNDNEKASYNKAVEASNSQNISNEDAEKITGSGEISNETNTEPIQNETAENGEKSGTEQ